MNKRVLGALAAACLVASPVSAAEFVERLVIDDSPLVLQGEGTASYLFWDVYDAALYAPAGATAAAIGAAEVPMSLVLEYHRDVRVADIRKATWKALDEQYEAAEREAIRPKIEAIQAAMIDVTDGDRYRLDWTPGSDRLVLRLNGETRFESGDAELARAYFGIWLAEPPLSETLRAALLSRAE